MLKSLFILIFMVLVQNLMAQDTIVLITGRKIVVSSIDLQDNKIAYRGLQAGSKLKTIDPERVFSVMYKAGNERIIYRPDSLDPLDFKVEEMRSFIKGEQDASVLYKNNLIKIIGVGVGGASSFLAFYGLVGPPLYATIIGSHSPKVENKLSFRVSGNAAGVLGIQEGKYVNEITGKNSSPVLLKDQKLKIGNKSFAFNKETNLDSVVSTINGGFKCARVHAVNDHGKLKLYKSDSPARISESAYGEGFDKVIRDYKIRNGMIYALIGFVAGAVTYSAVFKK